MDSSVTWEGVAVEMLAAESSKLQALMADPGTSADAVTVELCRCATVERQGLGIV